MKELILCVVTDGAHARLLEQTDISESFYQIQNLTHTHESTHEHGTDRPGRGFESSATARHAYEPRTDWHEHQKEIFIKQVSDLVIDMSQKEHYSKIFLICPPKIMGMMRAHLSQHTHASSMKEKQHIIEIDKDLTHSTIDVIQEHILSQSMPIQP